MSSNRIGAGGKWPRLPKFDAAGVPPGGDQSITLSEEDERLLDEIWAKIRRRPAKVFGGMLPPLPDTAEDAPALSGSGKRATPAGAANAGTAAPGRNGAGSSAAGGAKKRRKAAPRVG